MRLHPALIVIAGLLPWLPAAGARSWVDAPASAPACDGRSDTELGCDVTQCRGYGTASDWAEEIQVRFQLPRPTRGGPWLVEFVAFYMSGTGTHSVIVRNPGSRAARGPAPGPIVDTEFSFVPVSSSWPPEDWTYVDFAASAPYPAFLMGGEGERVMFGTALLPGDAIGLSAQAGEGDGWGYYQGTWVDDTEESGATPAVRIGLTDLGLSGADISTWSSVKSLFR